MVSRRDFLKQAGVAASAVLVAPRIAWCLVPQNALEAAKRRHKSVTLLHDADFSGDAWGWQFTPGATIDKSVHYQGNATLRVASRDGDYARFLVLSPRRGARYTLSGWMKTANVEPIDQGAGAFFSASQFEFQGRPAQLTAEGFDTREVRYGNWTGSHDWQRFTKTFTCLSETQWFEVAAGLFRASGTAWFSGMTFVEGDAPVALEDTVNPMTAVAWVHQEMLGNISRARPSAAILRDPALPVRGTASNPETLAALLRPHYESHFLTAREIADPARLNRENFDLLVLPYGETFPSEAHQNLLTFLENGGDFFSTGGYAFQSPVVEVNGKWRFNEELARETRSENLVPSGSFTAPSSALLAAGWHASDANACSIHDGAAQVSLPEGSWGKSADWSFTLAARGDAEQYWIAGDITTENVSGLQGGYAFFYLDQLDEDDQIVSGATEELIRLTGTVPSKREAQLIALTPITRKLRIRFGLVDATGTVSVHNVRLEHRGTEVRINTAKGFPQDELRVQPDQIGAFDPDYRLKRVERVVAAPGQPWFPEFPPLKGDFTGYAASGVLGMSDARWIPLVHALDGAGRLRGSAGALMHHYGGPFTRGSWMFFGVENADLFAADQPSLQKPLQQALGRFARKCFLSPTETGFTCYRQGETPRIRATAHNFGHARQQLRLRIQITGADGQQSFFEDSRNVSLGAGSTESVVFSWSSKHLPDGPLHVTSQLFVEEELLDTHLTSFEVWDPEVLTQVADSKYSDNYFRFDQRSVFLQGTDDYLHTFLDHQESPLTWHQDAVGCRDSCIDIYENLMGLRGPQQRPPETWWRWIDAMLLGIARAGGMFMPGLLIFSNTAVETTELNQQEAFCRAFAERYDRANGLMYYLNGDLELHDPNLPELQELYHTYLRHKYGSEEVLRAAWRISPPEAPIDKLSIHRGTEAWDDVRTLDDFLFRVELVKRWLHSLDTAIRRTGSQRPVMAEFYQSSNSGIDLVSGTDSLTYANFGYFGRRNDDRERFPQTLKFLDLSLIGKGANVGEFGVKTHPAWRQYDEFQEARTEAYEQAYFLALTHYAFGMGAAHVQNWCWKYPSDLPFEWGITYPCDGVPRDVRMYYRNTGLLFRRFRPASRAPENLFLIAGNNRKGGQGDRVHEGQLNGLRLLIDARVPYATLADEALDHLPASVKNIFYPLPYCPSDAIVARLSGWVRQGGTLYLSGDLSYDPLRRRARTDRLKSLCGVSFVRELYRNIAFQQVATPVAAANGSQWPSYTGAPGIAVVADGAGVLAAGKDGPVVTEFTLGSGRVLFSTDPIEMHAPALHSPDGHAFYAALLDHMQIDRESLQPASAPVHLFRPESQDGTQLFVAINISPEPQHDLQLPVQLSIPPHRTGFAAIGPDRSVQAIEGFGTMKNGNTLLLTSDLHVIALSADGRSLESARRILLLPMGEGTIRLPNPARWSSPVLLVGGVEEGRWRTRKRSKLSRQGDELLIHIDRDRDLSMLVLCESAEEAAVPALMERWVLEPWTLEEALRT